jgi:hypothetical protein
MCNSFDGLADLNFLLIFIYLFLIYLQHEDRGLGTALLDYSSDSAIYIQ